MGNEVRCARPDAVHGGAAPFASRNCATAASTWASRVEQLLVARARLDRALAVLPVVLGGDVDVERIGQDVPREPRPSEGGRDVDLRRPHRARQGRVPLELARHVALKEDRRQLRQATLGDRELCVDPRRGQVGHQSGTIVKQVGAREMFGRYLQVRERALSVTGVGSTSARPRCRHRCRRRRRGRSPRSARDESTGRRLRRCRAPPWCVAQGRAGGSST